MDDPAVCPKCGVRRPARSPGGMCPGCMLRQGLDTDGLSLSHPGEAGATISLAGDTVLHKLGASIGPVPRILLHDTTQGDATSPVVQPGSTEMPDAPPDRLQLFGEIARGGMGAILKGRDPDLGRDLAVKVLLERHGDDPDLVRRFVEEAQIAGQLQHPGIAPVYELGAFADARPYFTMKLVKGRTLAEMLAARGSPSADLPRFLAIFEAIAQTMAYAHARGVIHRDLKPSNVMVGSFGEVQVMDWGLAKVLPKGGVVDDAAAGRTDRHETVIATARSGSDDPNLSHPGSIMGTPAYMAPEQARGETSRVDERADVFALGSILCEILTGTPAFAGRSSGEIQRKAALGDTADALGRLDRSGADADLIELARACLAPEPEDRPRDAGAVSDCATAHLAGVQDRLRAAEIARAAEAARAEEATRTAEAEARRAEEAGRATEAAEARTQAERRARKLQFALAASLLVMSAVGGLSFTYVLQQRQARAATAERSLGEASTLLAQARERPEDSTRWRASLEATQRVEDRPGVRSRLAMLKAEAATGLGAAEADAALRAALFEARASRADLGSRATDKAFTRAWRAAGLDVDALAPAEVATRLRTRPAAVLAELVANLDYWSSLRRKATGPKPGGANESWRRPLEVARVVDRDPYRDRLRALLATDDRKAQATALLALAADPRSGDLAPPTAIFLANSLDKVKEIEAEVTLLRKVVAKHPQEAWANHTLAGALGRLRPARREEALRFYSVARGLRPEMAHEMAHLLAEMQRHDEAEDVFRDLTTRLPDHRLHLTCFGDFLKGRAKAAWLAEPRPGMADEAASVLERAVIASRAAIVREPDDWSAHKTLGDALADQGRFGDAVAAYREAVRLAPEEIAPRNNLGLALTRMKDHDGAIVELREALRLDPEDEKLHNNLAEALEEKGLLDESIGEHREAIRVRPGVGSHHEDLAHVLIKRGRVDEAIAEYREALRLEPGNAVCLSNLGNALGIKGDYEGAARACREAIRLAPRMAAGHHNLGIALIGLKKFDEAIAELREAVRLDPAMAAAHGSLGTALTRSGRPDAALDAYRESIRLDPGASTTLSNLGDTLLKLSRPAEAEVEIRKAIRVAAGNDTAWSNLGNALNALGRDDDAIAAYREAIRLKPGDAVYHRNLSNALMRAGQLDRALTECREALRLRPGLAAAHSTLATIRAAQGDGDGASAEFREAIRLDPDEPNVHCAYGAYLCDDRHDYEAATVEFREAIRLAPIEPRFRFNLGNALRGARRHDEAIAAYREAIRLGEEGAGIRENMGLAQYDKGDWDEALTSFRRAAELATPGSPRSEEVADLIRTVERYVALAKRLDGVRAGTDRPEDAAEAIDLAMICGRKSLFATGVRLFEDAFAADPGLAADRRLPHRYNAARAAALAGTGQGDDDPRPDDAARAKLRDRARDWLRADLAAWKRVAMTVEPGNRPLVAKTLRQWKAEADLAGLRDADALAKLPEAERAEWRALWTDVDGLLAKVAGP